MTRLELVRSAYDAWDRGDVEQLIQLSHPDVEIAPLVIGVTSVGPWSGHEGLQRLVSEARTRWDCFDVRCEDLLEIGDRVVAFVHLEVAPSGGAVVTGDIAHLIEFNGDVVTSFVAYREREDAIAAAEA